METFEFTEGTTPLLLSMPHDGTALPLDLANTMTAHARTTPDTDWHMARLYDFAGELGASILRPFYSRYVIDLNRDPTGTELYKNADNTELCPTTTFDFKSLYLPGEEPDAEEIAGRTRQYWEPYHAKLDAQLDALRQRHGVAVLFEGHTIRSEVPRFYKGRIPDLNLGTANGTSAAPELAEMAFTALLGRNYSVVWDERFTGGYITRRYGNPAAGFHALQLELTWRNYMNEKNFRYAAKRANHLKSLLEELLTQLIRWSFERGEGG